MNIINFRNSEFERESDFITFQSFESEEGCQSVNSD